MVVIEMIYNTNNPGSVDPYTLFLMLGKEIEVLLPDGETGTAQLVDVEALKMEGMFSLVLAFDDKYASVFYSEIDSNQISMN